MKLAMFALKTFTKYFREHNVLIKNPTLLQSESETPNRNVSLLLKRFSEKCQRHVSNIMTTIFFTGHVDKLIPRL